VFSDLPAEEPPGAPPPADDGPPTQPVPALERPAAPAREREPVAWEPRPSTPSHEPGPASHLEELPPQGERTRPAREPERDDGPVRFRAPTFDPPEFAGPPESRFAAMPVWLRIAIPIAILVALAVAAVVLLGGGDDASSALSTTEAVDLVRDQLDTDIPAAKAGAMVDQLCGAAETGSSTRAVAQARQLPVDDRAHLRSALEALGDGARRHCPDAEVSWSGLVDEVYRRASTDFPD
jgi:hypothetical protein